MAKNHRPQAGFGEWDQPYHALFVANPHPMWVYDPETLAFLDVNDAALRLYGYARDEFLGMTLKDIRPETDWPVLLENVRAPSAALEQSGVWCHRAKDGRVIFAEITSHALEYGGRKARLVLAHDVTERIRVEDELRRKSHDLRERLKELRCLYQIAEIIARDDTSLEDTLSEIAGALPPAWQYPEITGARIILYGAEFKTERFMENEWMQAADIQVDGNRAGTVEICYTEERPVSDEGPFLKEEREMLQLIAGKIGDLCERIHARQDLLASETRRSSILDTLVDGVIVINEQGIINEFNPAAEKLFGYEAREVLGKNVKILMPQPDRDRHDQYIDNYLSTGIGKIIGIGREVTGLRKNGNHIPLDLAITEMRIGRQRLFTGVVRDITERKEREDRIRHLNRIHRITSEINSMIIRAVARQEIYDETCRITTEQGRFGIAWIDEFDPETRRIRPAARAGTDAGQLLPLIQGAFAAQASDACPAELAANLHAIRQKRALVRPFAYPQSDAAGICEEPHSGTGYHSWIALPLIAEGRATAVLSILARAPGYPDQEEFQLLKDLAANISLGLDRLAKREKIHHLAFYDLLTGLPTRALFLERAQQTLERAIEKEQLTALVVISIEQFNRINDSYGRAAGDALIKSVAARLKKRTGDEYPLARIDEGGFTILVHHMHNVAEINNFVENLIESDFNEPFTFGEREMLISARAGIAVFPDDGGDAESLLMNAKAAQNRAVEEAKRFLFYAHEMNERVSEILEMEHKLRRALEQNQFILHYQPRVHAETGAITGLEALLRWRDPDSGLALPDQFIPILEDTGLIVPVGEWAMRQAVRDYRGWCELGLPAPRITVNISALQLRQQDFPDIVKNVLNGRAGAEHGLDMEITESMIMTAGEGISALLDKIRGMGVQIAIDDFGTGHSSLRYITSFPVDMLKIDRTFIADIQRNPKVLAVVSAIISLGHELGLKVVAEGVETEDQAGILRRLNCDELQGYLFSRPVPAENIESMLRE